MMCIIVCLYASYTDIRYGLIKNAIIFPFAVIGIFIDTFYYIKIFPTGVRAFLLNVITMLIFSFILYMTHIWAAGDSKLLILISILIPIRITVIENGYYYGFMIVVYAFAFAFFYLIGDTIRGLIKIKGHVSGEKIWNQFKQYIKRLVINSIYILTLSKLERYIFMKQGFMNMYIQIIINICVLLLIVRIPLFQKIYILGPVSIASFGFSYFTGLWMLGKDRAIYYCIVAIFLLLEILMGEFNYEMIPTDSVKKGMILSRFTTITFTVSRIKGLPAVSTEDLRSRLTEEEAKAVLKWGKSKMGAERVQVVRKVPFAIFITLGTAMFMIVSYIFR
ncbi:prepilin peptidase [Lachnoclostridium sp. Marseille-P6806]|uniref:prepilin peptidase n=1 Tax=Lachnoclostridium sp. Marseille-P6806 TaxID=2364793 RepID=UPI0013EEF27B|nr:prepilin peptidase [Lachnoclostridium sp. Marseille-P6806]